MSANRQSARPGLLLLRVLLAALSAPGCESKQHTDVPATREPQARSDRRIQSEIDAAKALELLYGSYDAKERRSSWKKWYKPGNHDFEIEAEYHSWELMTATFRQSGRDRFILITATAEPGQEGHAAGVSVGGALFSKDAEGWILDLEDRDIGEMGSHGGAPGGKLVQIGADRYAATFETGFTGQGYTEESLVLFAEVKGHIREIASVNDTYGDNAGACSDNRGDCWKFESSVEFIPGGHPDYYDMRVTTIGTEADGPGKVKPTRTVRTFVFQEYRYAIVP